MFECYVRPPTSNVATMSSIRSQSSAIDVRQLGTVDYLARLATAARPGRRPGRRRSRHAAAARTPSRLHRRAAHRAPRTAPPRHPVIDTDRGGKITWHGPGQLVGYPIIGLAEPLDVVNYVRRLEESLIRVCADVGLETHAGWTAGPGCGCLAEPACPRARSPPSVCGCRVRPRCTGLRSTATAIWTRSPPSSRAASAMPG